MNPKFKILIIILIYGISTYLFLTPYSQKMDKEIFGNSGDPLAVSSMLYWNHNKLINDIPNINNLNEFYPMKNSIIIGDIMIGNQIIYSFLWLFTQNPILLLNLIVLTSFFLCAVTMFYLTYSISGSLLGAFVAGFIFGFNPLKLGVSQIQFMTIFWFPLIFLFFYKFLKDKKLKHGVLFAITLSIQMLSSFYVGYMLCIALLIFFVLYVKPYKMETFSTQFYMKLAMIAIIIISIVGPTALTYSNSLNSNKFKPYLGEVVQYSANLDDYLQARPQNLIIGKLNTKTQPNKLTFEEGFFNFLRDTFSKQVGDMGGEKLPGSNLKEQLSFEKFSSIINNNSSEKNVFLGILPFVLSFFAYKYAKKTQDIEKSKVINIYVIILIAFLILSLGPFLIIFGHFAYIPLPYLVLYYLMPAFDVMRVASRFSYMAMFCVSVLSCFGTIYIVDVLSQKYKKFKYLSKPSVIVLLMTLLMTLEFITYPVQSEAVPVGEDVPKVYKWLKELEIFGGIAEVPSIKGDLSKYNEKYGNRKSEMINREVLYYYYSTHHKKPIINGHGSFQPKSYFEITSSLNNISKPKSKEILKGYNVNTFVVHYNFFDEEDKIIWSDENIEKAGLKMIAEFENEKVFTWK